MDIAQSSALDPEAPVRFQDLERLKFVLPGGSHGPRTIVDDCARKAGRMIDG